MKIKVLFLCDDLSIGGSQQVLVDWLRHFDYGAFEIAVCTLRPANAYGDLLDHLPVKLLSLNMAGPLAFSLDTWRAVLLLRNILNKEEPDILHTQNQESDVIGQIAARMSRFSTVVSTCHGGDVFRYESAIASVRYRLRMFLEDRAVGICKCFIAVSQDCRTYLERYRRVRHDAIVVIRNSVERMIRVREKAQAKEILFGDARSVVVAMVGRLAATKNCGTALDAFRRARNHIPSLRCVIAGDGPDRELIERFLARHQMTTSVMLAGTTTDVQPYLEAADMFLLASFVEGLGLVLLEAMSLGVPVLAPRVGGIPEIVHDGENGILFPPSPMRAMARIFAAERDTKGEIYVDEVLSSAMADAIIELAEHPLKCTAMGNAGEQYFNAGPTVEGNVRIVEDTYRRLIAGNFP